MEIKRFGDMQGNTIMLLHGNLMCWRQFEDLIPLLEKKFRVYAVSFDGFDGTGNADHAPPYSELYQSGIRPGHLGGRALSLSVGLSGTARCKGRLLVRRKRRTHEKSHPAAADGISGSDCPLLPRFRSWRYHQSSGAACIGAGTLSDGWRNREMC